VVREQAQFYPKRLASVQPSDMFTIGLAFADAYGTK
jgi:hypothetical protein